MTGGKNSYVVHTDSKQDARKTNRVDWWSGYSHGGHFFSNITGREGSSNLTFSDSSAIEKTMERENLECHQAILSRYNNLFDSPLASVG